MKKIATEYELASIPDLAELEKQISETNELRHKFWSKLRAVRNQIGRYIYAHEIEPEEFYRKIKKLSSDEKKFYEKEWKVGRGILLADLEKMFSRCNSLWTVSQSEEKMRKQSADKGYTL